MASSGVARDNSQLCGRNTLFQPVFSLLAIALSAAKSLEMRTFWYAIDTPKRHEWQEFPVNGFETGNSRCSDSRVAAKRAASTQMDCKIRLLPPSYSLNGRAAIGGSRSAQHGGRRWHRGCLGHARARWALFQLTDVTPHQGASRYGPAALRESGPLYRRTAEELAVTPRHGWVRPAERRALQRRPRRMG